LAQVGLRIAKTFLRHREAYTVDGSSPMGSFLRHGMYGNTRLDSRSL